MATEPRWRLERVQMELDYCSADDDISSDESVYTECVEQFSVDGPSSSDGDETALYDDTDGSATEAVVPVVEL